MTPPTEGADAATLSAENAAILAELEGSGEGAAPAKDEKKDGKKKKEKKPKEKKPKEKKPPKPPKPPKEKKPKVKDNTPPLPKIPVLMIFIMVISMTVLVYLGSTLLTYSSAIKEAESDYDNAEYIEAFRVVGGMEIKDGDVEFYNKVLIMACVEEKYYSYQVFVDYGNETDALDALICAYGRCGVNSERAEEYGCSGELEKMKLAIAEELQNHYSITEEEAEELYDTKRRKDYTVGILKKILELDME